VAVDIGGQPLPVARTTAPTQGAGTPAGVTLGERASFTVSVDTRAWEPGERPIRVLARDGTGAEASLTGTVDILPYELAPARLGDIVADAAAGRPVLSCDDPPLDGTFEAHAQLRVRGWAYARGNLDAVLVSLDDGPRQPVRRGAPRPDVADQIGPDAADAGWELVLDVRELDEGEHRLTVVAVGGDGRTVGVEGTIRSRRDPRPEQDDGKGVGIPERFVPEELRGHLIDAEHQARYRWAAALAVGSEVLDAACGVGYGAEILVNSGARRVVGLDLSAEAVLNARERVGGAAEFILGDLRRLPFEDDAFDLITCFEAIEHVVDGHVVLDELRRVLRPTGVLLISSPNREVFTPGNPHHVHEYTPAELEAALGARFAHVRLHRQNAHLASLLAGESAFTAQGAVEPLVAEVRKLVTAPTELYTVAAAGEAELPALPDVVTLGGVFEVRQIMEFAWAWEERAIVAEADAAASRGEQQLAALARERAEELVEDSEARLRAAESAQAQLEAVRSSASWRLTAPLRQVAGAARAPLRRATDAARRRAR